MALALSVLSLQVDSMTLQYMSDAVRSPTCKLALCLKLSPHPACACRTVVSGCQAEVWLCCQVLPQLDPQQQEAFEVVQELYASPRMLLAVLDRQLLAQARCDLLCCPAHRLLAVLHHAQVTCSTGILVHLGV